MTASKTIQHTFFDSLMLSDSERIHSQMLGWILNLPKEIFTIESKKSFLNELFDFEDQINIVQEFKVHTEINRIDILIETDNYIIVLENKLKSSEHSFQSFKYLDSIPDNIQKSGKNIKFAFISLIGEKPKNSNWSVITYQHLLENLTSIVWNDTLKETVFIKEYIQTLSNLVNVFNEFMNNHHKFDTVFKDGPKSKHHKFQYDDELKDYIRVNQLETIFQKAFLKAVAVDANLEDYVIHETRGTALIQFFVASIAYEEKEYHLGLQFQGDCLKINLILQSKSKSKNRRIPEKLRNYFGHTYSKQNNYKRFNKNNTNPYISVTKTIPAKLHQMDRKEVGKILVEEIESIKLNLDNFRSQLIILN